MDLSELKEFVGLLRDLGVTHYKSGDTEITLSQQVGPTKGLKPASLATPPTEPDKEIPHVIQEMKAVMNMDDLSLLDKILPVGTPEN